ncbi:MAG: hypothetical protein U1A28_03505, partial [Patescibacteria group bacterium]|nr:hypothetical protein [Patescibacteria group bacterium]
VTITEFDAIIERVENKFLSIAEQLKGKIVLLPYAPLREQLDLPRQVVLINKGNPWRNAYRFEQAMQHEKYFEQENINYFSYQLLEDRRPNDTTMHHAIAAYAPLTRKFYLSRGVVHMNVLDFVIAAHELFHVTQDTRERTRLNSEQQFMEYVNFYSTNRGESPRIILNNETTAYAYELELLDLLLDGKLRSVTLSKDVAAVTSLGGAIHIRAEQEQTFESLVGLASLYFPNGMTKNGLPAEFVHQIARIYRRVGFELYTRDAGGRRKILPHELPN